jgi:heterodisulfide reductase subunit B
MQIGYFPGCSLTSTAREYDASVRQVAQNCGFDLVEIEDWNCCGASPADAVSQELVLALSAKNLAKAQRQGLTSILSPCPACHSHLLQARQGLAEKSPRRSRILELIDEAAAPAVTLRHLVDFLYHDVGIEKLKATVVKPLTGITVASYYGCLTRLKAIDMENRENPAMLDEIIGALGATAVDWSHKTECCGAGLAITSTQTVLRLTGDILAGARSAGAQALVAVCPLCQANLDMRQAELDRCRAKPFNLPVIYLSQLVLIAQGTSFQEAGFDKHLISPRGIFQQ